MSAYLPTAHNIAGFAGLIVVLAICLLLGAACTGRDDAPETKLVAGWGAMCLVLTAWGVTTAADLRWPFGALAVIALAIRLSARTRVRLAGLESAVRIGVLTLPLWLVMLPLLPSEIDTWWNLLPNAAYLFDYGMLPTLARPESYSFIPVAPYNTQFIAFGASVVSGSLAESAMGWFNIALLCAAGLLMARVVADGPAMARITLPPWWACAAGLLLAVPLNPGFVPRVFMSSYGEAPLAVTVLFAVWLGADTLEQMRGEPMRGDPLHARTWPRSLPALALVLAAMVNIKQSGLGLVLPVGATMFALALTDGGIPARRAVRVTGAALLPAMALYGVWRVFATASFPEGELKLLPFAEWNWGLLPGIVLAMLHVMVQKIAYFVVQTAALVFAVLAVRRERAAAVWSREALLLGMTAGIVVLFYGFLVFTYVAHFPAVWALEAHSYFRYSSQLSLAVMLAVMVALRPFVAARLAALPVVPLRRIATGAIVLVAVLPLVGIAALRFDLDTPQPELRAVVRDAAPYVKPHSRIALLLPNDRDDADASMVRGLLMFTPPRRPALDLRTETKADAATLAALAADGFSWALVTCVPAGLADAPAGQAALLNFVDGTWKTVESTGYPADLRGRRFLAMLQRGPVCAAR